jgi:hypothetical protein
LKIANIHYMDDDNFMNHLQDVTLDEIVRHDISISTDANGEVNADYKTSKFGTRVYHFGIHTE